MDDDIVTLRNTFAPLLPWVYMWRYSIGFVAKKIKGRSSRILGQESPHLKEWYGDHLWSPGCYHGSVGDRAGKLLRNTFPRRTALLIRRLYMQKNANKPCSLSTGVVTEGDRHFVHPLEYVKPR
ncbi:MAG: transposase [Candidatus Methanoperedens sp.]|nr:transposase [Candidatus Methanoperedens sp.]